MSDMTAAASEAAFAHIFAGFRDTFTLSDADTASWSGLSASYAIAAHLEGGTVDLRGDNTIEVSELDILWDTLKVSVGVDLPEICVGGWCIVPNLFGGCLVRLPRLCIFSGNPDISLPIDLSGLLRSEVSAIGELNTRYSVNPSRPPGFDYVDAHVAGVPNEWQVLLRLDSLDIDPFDIPDIVGDLIENAINSVVDGALWFLPGWARDLVKAILGAPVALVRALLDIPDDLLEWVADLLGTKLGLLNRIATGIANHFLQKPLFGFEDPMLIMPAEAGLIPVGVPITDLAVHVTDDELVVEANVGT